jgi:hypothetical protein
MPLFVRSGTAASNRVTDSGIETDVDQPARFFHAAVAPGREQRSFAAQRTGAEAKCGNHEARCAQIAIMHGGLPVVAKYEGGERRVDVVEFIEICKAIEADPNKLLKVLIQRAA